MNNDWAYKKISNNDQSYFIDSHETEYFNNDDIEILKHFRFILDTYKKKRSVYTSELYQKNGELLFFIFRKFKDDWYIFELSDPSENLYEYYLCDEVSGFKECIEDTIYNFFN